MSARNARSSETPRYRIYVGNLPKTCLQSHVDQILEGCNILQTTMMRDSSTDEFRGYAYVELRDEASYLKALTYNQTVVNGQTIRVNDADRGGSRDGRGRGDFNGRNSYARGGAVGGGRQGQTGGNGFGNRPRTGAYRPRVQPGVIGYQEEFSNPPPINRSSGESLPPPNLDASDRPRLLIKPRSTPIDANKQERELSERAKSIFGVGKPRDASPSRKASE